MREGRWERAAPCGTLRFWRAGTDFVLRNASLLESGDGLRPTERSLLESGNGLRPMERFAFGERERTSSYGRLRFWKAGTDFVLRNASLLESGNGLGPMERFAFGERGRTSSYGTLAFGERERTSSYGTLRYWITRSGFVQIEETNTYWVIP